MSGMKELGKVTVAEITKEDHGMTFCIDIDFGGASQAFANYGLDAWDEKKNRRVGTAAGCDLILQLLRLFKVNRFDKMVGRSVYALRKSDKYGEMIIGLQLPEFDGSGKFLIEDWQKEWQLEVAAQ